MAPVSTNLLFGLLATTALAFPTEQVKEKRGFRVSVERSEPVLARRDTGDSKAQYDGGGWLLPVKIGGQDLYLNIDTGSADIWTATTLLSDKQQKYVQTPGGNLLYNPKKSDHYKRVPGETFDVLYGDGSEASGPVGTDIVNIGGATVNMPFGVCNKLKQPGGSRTSDGPVGLGFDSGNSETPKKGPTFIGAISDQLPQPIFATYLTLGQNGHVDFGFEDKALYKGDFVNTPIDKSDGQWKAHSIKFGVPGNMFPGGGITMGFDTGNPTLYIPADTARQYFSNVKGASHASGEWQFPCSSDLPALVLDFGQATSSDSKVNIPGNAIKQGVVSGDTCRSWIDTFTDDSDGNAGTPMWTSKYIVWRPEAPSMGFADQQ